jgi:hypothetical protein
LNQEWNDESDNAHHLYHCRPGEWVSEEQIMALKGLKEGTLKNARKKSFMEGREYKHVAADG